MMAARKKAVKVARTETLLVELLTEELPPKSLQRLSEAFAQGMLDGLRANAFIADGAQATPYATPRRLALTVPGVLAVQPDRVIERKGPAVSAGFDSEGQPTPALTGFAKSCGVTPERLERRAGDKGEQFVHISAREGEPLAEHLAAIAEAALKKLPVAKLMRWGDGEAQFVRPVHGVILLHGSKVVPGTVLGLKSGNKTLGHRFLSRGAITIPNAEKYAATLHSRGKVIASFEERREIIKGGILRAAGNAWVLPGGVGEPTNDIIQRNFGLLDEVTSLVEWPKVHAGTFDKEFLEVPAECLALSMQSHQRYFPLLDPPPPATKQARNLFPNASNAAHPYLRERFLVVSNNNPRESRNIVHGNERVLRARLSDARFFYKQDLKHRLAEHVPKLRQIVYHNKLGTQYDRVQRLEKLAEQIASMIHAHDVEAVTLAAHLCKADLVTEMVGEFPELQGVMGAYYANRADNDAEKADVVNAIRDHYRPRFAGDVLPQGTVSISVALADKLDTLVGIYGIGLVPTGDKDPYGLRRQALGVIRIIVESRMLPSLDLSELFEMARSGFPAGVLSATVVGDLHGFFLDRLRPYLRERNFAPDEIEAVFALTPKRLDEIVKRLGALREFRRLPEAESLAAANKRIRNILKQAGTAPNGPFDPARAAQDEERVLGECVAAIKDEVERLFAQGDYERGLKKLAGLRPAVDAFFDKVLVMHEDEAIRKNRLALLTGLSDLFLGVADISRLQS